MRRSSLLQAISIPAIALSLMVVGNIARADVTVNFTDNAAFLFSNPNDSLALNGITKTLTLQYGVAKTTEITDYTFTVADSQLTNNSVEFDASRLLTLDGVSQTVAQTATIKITPPGDTATLTASSDYIFTLASGDEVQVTALGFSQDAYALGPFSGTQSATFTLLAVPEPAFYQLSGLIVMGGLGVLRMRRRK